MGVSREGLVCPLMETQRPSERNSRIRSTPSKTSSTGTLAPPIQMDQAHRQRQHHLQPPLRHHLRPPAVAQGAHWKPASICAHPTSLPLGSLHVSFVHFDIFSGTAVTSGWD